MSNQISEMTWQENKKAFETKKLAIIPVGSTEQHGPHLPVGTDWMVADYLAKEIGKRTNKALVTPVIPFGHAVYHNDFAGTLAVSQSTLVAYVQEVCEQMIKYGSTHILFINGHGGNNNPLYQVGQHFRLKGIPVANIQWYEVAGSLNNQWGLRGHADIGETAAMLHINRDLVKMNLANVPTNKSFGAIHLLDLNRGEFEGANIYLNIRTKDVSDTGDLLEIGHSANVDYTTSPREATPELGAEVFDAVIEYTLRFIDEFLKMEY